MKKKLLWFFLYKVFCLIPDGSRYPSILNMRNEYKLRYLRSSGYRIGDHCRINGILDGVNPSSIGIGNYVVLGMNSVILAHDPFNKVSGTVIEDAVFIGWGAIILPNVRLSYGSVVGAGAVVTSDVPPYAVVAGNPAKVIKYITPEYVEAYKAKLSNGQRLGQNED